MLCCFQEKYCGLNVYNKVLIIGDHLHSALNKVFLNASVGCYLWRCQGLRKCSWSHRWRSFRLDRRRYRFLQVWGVQGQRCPLQEGDFKFLSLFLHCSIIINLDVIGWWRIRCLVHTNMTSMCIQTYEQTVVIGRLIRCRFLIGWLVVILSVYSLP